MVNSQSGKKQKKRFLFPVVAVFFVGMFLFGVPQASAWWWDDMMSSTFFYVLNFFLFVIFQIVALLVDLATNVLAAAIDAEMVQRLFNLGAIYTLWGMVRDFFNLFFILTLLFVAFGTIFQIQSFNYKKWLLNLVLMALLVNFSFPVTRFVIDATNVPMYFFFESMFVGPTEPGSQAVSTVLSASKVKEILMQRSDKTQIGLDNLGDKTGDATQQLMTAIIFIFLFGAALLVLSLLFLIRWIMLIILLIFSPVGFAASAIPGFQKYSKTWWDNLLKYALFGPSAALMLLVSVKVMDAFTAEMSKTVTANATNMASNNIVPALTQSMVPLILVWLSISIGQTMGIQGGAAISGAATKFAKKTGRQLSGYNTIKGKIDKNVGAFKNERMRRENAKFAVSNIGRTLGKKTNNAWDRVNSVAGGKAVRNFSLDRLQESQQASVKEAAAKNRINGMMNDADLKNLHEKSRGKKGSEAVHAATTAEMAGRKSMASEVTGEDVAAVKNFFKSIGTNKNAVAEDTVEKVAKMNATAAYNNDEQAMHDAFDSGKIKAEDQVATALTPELLVAASRAGSLDQKQLLEMKKDTSKATALSESLPLATDAVAAAYKAKTDAGTNKVDDDKHMERMQRMYLATKGDFHKASKENPEILTKVLKKSNEETLMEMGKKNDGRDLATIMPKLLVASGSSRSVNILAKLAEEGIKVQPATGIISATASSSGHGISDEMRNSAQSAQRIMEKDHRFGWVGPDSNKKDDPSRTA